VLTRDTLDLDSPMKPLRTACPAIAVVLMTGLAVTWIAGHHRFGASDRRGSAQGPPSLATANDPVLRRVALKQEVAAALLRHDIDLAEAASRFQEVNGNDPARFASLREQYPHAGDDELTFRQVLHFVRWAGRPLAELVPSRLPQLEAEFFARFQASDPFPLWFGTERSSSTTGADGQMPPGTHRAGRG
jgi:hypothetical protein